MSKQCTWVGGHRVTSSALGGKPSLRLPKCEDPSGPQNPYSFHYLGTQCRLFMEIAMHELTVLPSGDLAAVDRKQTGISILKSMCLLGLEPSTWAWQAGWDKLLSISLPLDPCLSLLPESKEQKTVTEVHQPAEAGWGHRLTCPWYRCSRGGL